jgi:hypothetical protein
MRKNWWDMQASKTQLFKFFQDHVQTEGNLVATNLTDLNSQHKVCKFAKAVTIALEEASSGGAG